MNALRISTRGNCRRGHHTKSRQCVEIERSELLRTFGGDDGPSPGVSSELGGHSRSRLVIHPNRTVQDAQNDRPNSLRHRHRTRQGILRRCTRRSHPLYPNGRMKLAVGIHFSFSSLSRVVDACVLPTRKTLSAVERNFCELGGGAGSTLHTIRCGIQAEGVLDGDSLLATKKGPGWMSPSHPQCRGVRCSGKYESPLRQKTP